MTMTCAIGLMSGTSMDGIDLAVVRTDGEAAIETGPSLFVPYEPEFRRRLDSALDTAKAIVRREDRPGDLADLEREITLRHARAVERFLDGAAKGFGTPDMIGFHGQTVLHRPQAGVTVQLGDGGLLAKSTGLPVVYDMRAHDMALGGHGAPLVPAYHAARARSLPPQWRKFPVVFVNIGGISNVTWIPEEGDPVAFDTGTGNMLIDQWVAREAGVGFDEGGAIAAGGRVSEAVVARYLDHPYYAEPGPKSLDRKDFSVDLADGLSLADGARTLAAVSARTILMSVEHMPAAPKLWVLCGGGRRNPHIVGDLAEGARAMGAEVVTAEQAGLDGDATEAEAWAYLAARARRGLPLTFPTTTGCREAASGGLLARPDAA